MMLALSIHYSRASDLVRPDHLVTSPSVPVTAYRDLFGNWCSRIVAPQGRFVLSTDALIHDSGAPDRVAPGARQTPVEDLPESWKTRVGQDLFPMTDADAKAAGEAFLKELTDRGVSVGKAMMAVSKNADIPRYPASTTKVMTGLLLAENTLPEDTIVAPSDVDAITGSKMHLKPGEKVSAGDMLYALMLRSANDGCYAVALHISGSVPAFAKLMNQRAQELGCTHTHFHNPNGLNDTQHLTTAHDLAMIAITPAGWYDWDSKSLLPGTPAMVELQPTLQRARDAGIGLVGMKAARYLSSGGGKGLENAFDGHYSDKLLQSGLSPWQRSYAFVLAHGVDVVNSDMQNFAHFKENLAAVQRSAELFVTA